MSHQAITEAIAETKSQEKRHRLLPTHLIIALVIALSLWSKDSVGDVLKNLVQGLSVKWIPQGIKWKTPSKSSRARSTPKSRVCCNDQTIGETSSTNGNEGNSISFFERITMDGY